MSPEVWVFCPEGPLTGATAPILDATEGECKKRNWIYKRRSVRLSKTALPRRSLYLVDAGDAIELYRRIHRTRVAILSIQEPGRPGPLLCTRQMAYEPLRIGALTSLRQYGMYKAFFRRLIDKRHPTRWAGSFEHWSNVVECEGRHDPRCLPLHIFEPNVGFRRGLQSAVGRADFELQHRSGNDRRDIEGRIWAGSGPDHGIEALAIAGRTLENGFHWDVSNQGRAEITIHTPNETWRIREYVNIYPDGKLRGSEPYARKIQEHKHRKP